MKVKDEAAWQERRAALTVDGEIGVAFLAFVEDWADRVDATWDDQTSAAEWFRRALGAVEQARGRTDFLMLGQMLAVLAEHWHLGDQLMKGLTPIERRLVEDLTLVKVAHEMQKAETHASTNQSSGTLPDMSGVQPDGQQAPDQAGDAGA